MDARMKGRLRSYAECQPRTIRMREVKPGDELLIFSLSAFRWGYSKILSIKPSDLPVDQYRNGEVVMVVTEEQSGYYSLSEEVRISSIKEEKV